MPCLFLAQDYTLLPRLSRHLGADDCLQIPRTWIVKFFVTSDVLTFLAQLAGTALTIVGAFIDPYANIGRIVSDHQLPTLAMRFIHVLDALDGLQVLLVALIVQALCFGGFIVIFAVFIKRM